MATENGDARSISLGMGLEARDVGDITSPSKPLLKPENGKRDRTAAIELLDQLWSFEEDALQALGFSPIVTQ
jgi:hypothetical protein